MRNVSTTRPLHTTMVAIGLILTWLGVGPAQLSAHSNEEPPWTLVTTEHFNIYSGAGRSAGLELAANLEMLHAVLEQLAGHDTESPVDTLVFLFPSDSALQPFKPAHADGQRGSGRAVTGGYFAPREFANYVAINLRTARSAREVIQHEYLHYFSQHNLPKLPFWFNEGLAEYYSTFTVDDGIGRVGAPVARHLGLLRRARDFGLGRRDIEELVRTESSKELFDDSHSASQAYSQSWALVHYLLSEDDLAASTLDFMRELASGRDQHEAFYAAFSQEPADLSGRLRQYIGDAEFPVFRARVAAVATPSMRTLDPLERDVALGDLAIAIGDLGLAERYFSHVLEQSERRQQPIGPSDYSVESQASVGLARAALKANDLDRALYHARWANQVDTPESGSHLPPLVLGRVLFSLSETLTRSPNTIETIHEQVDQARVALQQSLRINPRFPATLLTLGQTFIRDPRTPYAGRGYSEPGVSSYRQALELDSKRPDLATQAAMLLTLRGQAADGSSLLHREAARFSPDSWEHAWRRIGSIEHSLLHRELNRSGREPLSRDQLESVTARVNWFDDAVFTNDHLRSFQVEVDTLGRLLELESLWTQLVEVASTPPERVSAEAQVNAILDALDTNPALEGPRASELEARARLELNRLRGTP